MYAIPTSHQTVSREFHLGVIPLKQFEIPDILTPEILTRQWMVVMEGKIGRVERRRGGGKEVEGDDDQQGQGEEEGGS